MTLGDQTPWNTYLTLNVVNGQSVEKFSRCDVANSFYLLYHLFCHILQVQLDTCATKERVVLNNFQTSIRDGRIATKSAWKGHRLLNILQ